MTMLLQIILAVSITTITIFLVLLLIQARHTAASVQRFAESAEQDLHLVATDLHEVRKRVDEVSLLVQATCEQPSFLTQLVAGIVRGLPSAFDPRGGSGGFLEILLTGIRTALHLFRGRRAARPEGGVP